MWGTFSTHREAVDAIESHKARGNQDFLETPEVPVFSNKPIKPTFTERVRSKWQSIKGSLEKRNLL